MNCTLCHCEDFEFVFHQAHLKRDFFKCNNCGLHFTDKHSHLAPEYERTRYAQHNNTKRDSGYITFLSKLLNPVLDLVSTDSLGLDFGSGPYPMMQELAIERGYKVNIFDPFFANDENILKLKYDFITCCEVVEHFHNPYKTFDQIVECLKEGAILGVMTSILYPEINFDSWYYIQDDTHVSLYGPQTLNWIAQNWGLKIIYQQQNIVIFQSLRKIKG